MTIKETYEKIPDILDELSDIQHAGNGLNQEQLKDYVDRLETAYSILTNDMY